jgi:hypothetical protein
MNEMANHSQEPNVTIDSSASTHIDNQTSDTPVDSTTVSSNDTSSVSTPDTEYDVIRYNKQEVKIPVSERQTYLQKGYNYDKLQSQYQEAQKQAQYLDRLANMQGFNNTGEFLSALEQYEQEQRIAREAERMGVDESVIRDHLNPLKSELEQIKRQNEELRQYEIRRQVEADITAMRNKYADFGQYEDAIFELASRGLNLEEAYRLASYETVSRRVEQEVLARMKQRDDKQVLSSSDRGQNQKLNPQHMSLEDIEAISARVARGERISF